MKRRLLSWIVCLIALGSAARAAEPVYIFRTATGEVFRTTLTVTAAADGGRTVVVHSLLTATTATGPGAPPAFPPLNTTLSLDASGHLRKVRTESPLIASGGVLEVTPLGQGVSVRSPETTGSIPLGAPLITPLDAIAFIGKRYDFARGGVQSYAMLIGSPAAPSLLATITLEAAGRETIHLESGDVSATKLHVGIMPPGHTGAPASADLFVGAQGEYLKSTLPGLGDTVTAKGPARVQDGAVVTDYTSPGPPVIMRRFATETGYHADLLAGTVKVGSINADKGFRPTTMQHMFFGRSFETTITPGQLQWKLAPGEAQFSAIENDPWFFTHWLVTDLWENSEPFAAMKTGQLQKGSFFLLEIGIATAIPFTTERLNDISVARGDGAEAVLRHWRMSYPTTVTDLWTDGSRLVKLLSSDKTTIVREGWEKATADLPVPAAPVAAPVAAPK